MGKIYIDTVKYVIHANIEIDGLVEKPDVVGAIFGQTEGLLGEELDLRELQKNGRIGRIEVNITPRGGKSIGNIEIPSSLDIVETSIIAAAVETVDRVGPCEARVTVQRVEDTRNIKRKKLIERAKMLVKRLITTEIPERKELTELVRQEVRTAEVSTYGPDKLVSGPNITSFDSIILVEGRADVINLLKNDVNNVIAIGGATIPKSIIDLCKKKEVTVFVDGDRGGDIILREVINACEVDYVARAPPGKEVEELARKEILKALRARVPIEQVETAIAVARRRGETETEAISKSISAIVETHPETREELSGTEKISAGGLEQISPEPQEAQMALGPALEGIPQEIANNLMALEGSLRARLYDSNMNMIKEIAIRDLTNEITSVPNVAVVVMDGIITQRLVDIAESMKIRVLAGMRMGNVFRKPEGLQIFTKEQM
ncbi:MAG: DNA primase DnaG [Candidatus Micrarchaeia archaeon]